jgi:D-lyxose ketol-isomerase
MKLIDLLREIGDSSNIKPYGNAKRYTDDESGFDEAETEYHWTTDDTEPKVKYKLVITKFRMDEEDEDSVDLAYDVLFGITDKYDVTDYSVTSKDVKTGSLFRTMVTVIDLIKKEIVIDEKIGMHVKQVYMTPSKRYSGDKKDLTDMRRANLYMAYIKKSMPPGSTVNMDPQGHDITIELP